MPPASGSRSFPPFSHSCRRQIPDGRRADPHPESPPGISEVQRGTIDHRQTARQRWGECEYTSKPTHSRVEKEKRAESNCGGKYPGPDQLVQFARRGEILRCRKPALVRGRSYHTGTKRGHTTDKQAYSEKGGRKLIGEAESVRCAIPRSGVGTRRPHVRSTPPSVIYKKPTPPTN